MTIKVRETIALDTRMYILYGIRVSAGQFCVDNVLICREYRHQPTLCAIWRVLSRPLRMKYCVLSDICGSDTFIIYMCLCMAIWTGVWTLVCASEFRECQNWTIF